jgi:hypothetical protein
VSKVLNPILITPQNTVVHLNTGSLGITSGIAMSTDNPRRVKAVIRLSSSPRTNASIILRQIDPDTQKAPQYRTVLAMNDKNLRMQPICASPY